MQGLQLQTSRSASTCYCITSYVRVHPLSASRTRGDPDAFSTPASDSICLLSTVIWLELLGTACSLPAADITRSVHIEDISRRSSTQRAVCIRSPAWRRWTSAGGPGSVNVSPYPSDNCLGQLLPSSLRMHLYVCFFAWPAQSNARFDNVTQTQMLHLGGNRFCPSHGPCCPCGDSLGRCFAKGRLKVSGRCRIRLTSAKLYAEKPSARRSLSNMSQSCLTRPLWGCK